ncbi:MAG: YybS family protein [Bacillota bacterium]
MPVKTSSVAQGALMAAVAAMLGLVSLFIPVIGAVATVLWSIPIILLALRFELRTAGLSLIVALTLIGLVAGPIAGISLGLKSGLTALVFGYAFKKSLSPGVSFLAGGLTSAIGTALSLLIVFLIMGGASLGFGELELMVDQVLSFYEETGLINVMLTQGLTVAEFRAQLMQIMALVAALIPGSLVLSSLFAAGITYLLAREILRRMGQTFKPLPSFQNWQLPWWTVYGLIVGLALFLGGDYLGSNFLNAAGKNIIFIYLPILLLNGLAVAVYFYHHWTITAFIKVFLVIMFLINLPVTLPLVILIGVFDPLFDYRKIKFIRKEGE